MNTLTIVGIVVYIVGFIFTIGSTSEWCSGSVDSVISVIFASLLFPLFWLMVSIYCFFTTDQKHIVIIRNYIVKFFIIVGKGFKYLTYPLWKL